MIILLLSTGALAVGAANRCKIPRSGGGSFDSGWESARQKVARQVSEIGEAVNPTTKEDAYEKPHPVASGSGALGGAAGAAVGSVAGPVGDYGWRDWRWVAGGAAGHEVGEAVNPTEPVNNVKKLTAASGTGMAAGAATGAAIGGRWSSRFIGRRCHWCCSRCSHTVTPQQNTLEGAIQKKIPTGAITTIQRLTIAKAMITITTIAQRMIMVTVRHHFNTAMTLKVLKMIYAMIGNNSKVIHV